uniref:Uncharacterized protein n=1 Tax=Rhizophora mucronata TaxID=61149 RepID=A0A2P2KQ47_RHIMU
MKRTKFKIFLNQIQDISPFHSLIFS